MIIELEIKRNNIFEYIRNNPLKAGLVNDASDWSWTWINPEYYYKVFSRFREFVKYRLKLAGFSKPPL